MLVTTPLVFAAIGGLVWGVLGSSMPGMSASITMALLLPFTYTLDAGTGDRNARVLLYRRRVWRIRSRDPDPHARHERRRGDDPRRL